MASLVAQRLKRLPPMRETRVRSLGLEYPLEKEMAIHSSILAWRIPRMGEPGGLLSMGSQESDTTDMTQQQQQQTHDNIALSQNASFSHHDLCT